MVCHYVSVEFGTVNPTNESMYLLKFHFEGWVSLGICLNLVENWTQKVGPGICFSTVKKGIQKTDSMYLLSIVKKVSPSICFSIFFINSVAALLWIESLHLKIVGNKLILNEKYIKVKFFYNVILKLTVTCICWSVFKVNIWHLKYLLHIARAWKSKF